MSLWPNNPNAFPSILVSIGAIGLIILSTVIFSGLAAGLFEDISNPWYLLISYGLSFGVSFVVLYYVRGKDKPLYFTKVPAGIYILLIIPTIGLVFLREPLIHIAEFFFPMPDTITDQFSALSHWHPALFLTIAILAPVLEELIFRGIILDGFLQRYDPWKAIIWSSIIFGIAHFNPWQFISAFALGVVIGWLYWKTRSLGPAIFLHFFNNAGAYIASTLLGEDQLTTGTEAMLSPVAYSILLFFSLYITILFIHWIGVFLTRRPVFWENETEL